METTTETTTATTTIATPRIDPAEWRELDRQGLVKLIHARGLADGAPLWSAKKHDLQEFAAGVTEHLPGDNGQRRGPGRPRTRKATTPRSRKATTPRAPRNRKGETEITGFVNFDLDALSSQIDARIEKAVADAVENIEPVESGPATTTINVKGTETRTVEIEGKVHAKFAEAMEMIAAGLPVLLVGPAGSGKTTLAAQIAAALDRSFSFNSFSAGVTETSLLGRTLPDGDNRWTYRPSPFVRTFTDGGVHLFDEVDAADPNLMVIVNAAIANGKLSVPTKEDPEPIDRHEDTVLIAAANTYGRGANAEYVGRNKLDAATLDRFSMSTIDVDYDTDLEYAIVHETIADNDTADLLIGWAWGVRAAIERTHVRRLMSTRTLANAARTMANGADLETVKARYFRGWSADERTKVES